MFDRLGHLVYRRRRLVLALTGLFVAVAVGWGTGVFGSLSDGGFEDPASESSRAAAAIDEQFGHVASDVVVVYQAPEGSGMTVEDAAFEQSVQDAVGSLPRADVTAVSSYWTSGGAPRFVSADGQTTFVTLTLAGDDEVARDAAYARIADGLVSPDLHTWRGGQVPTFNDVNGQVEQDIARAETVSLPLLLILLVVVFGSLAAASLPLVVGGLAILGAFTVLNVLTRIGDVSVFAINIVTMLGLGLAIDYALFMVSRFREELASGSDVESAVVRTMSTAGRTVAVSGLTVAVALGSLLLFPMNFLRSMGMGGIAAVLIAMAAALTTLPALLAVMGRQVDSLRVPWRRGLAPAGTSDSGAWARLATAVMRRPLLVAGATVALLVALGLPFFQVALGGVDSRVLPEGTESRVAAETLEAEFPGTAALPVEVLVRGADDASLDATVTHLSEVPGATTVAVTARSGDAAVVAVSFDGEATAAEAQSLVRDIRALDLPDGVTASVAGETARLVDLLAGLGSVLPWALAYLALATFVLLFLAFGSVVLPVKAMVMSVLSMSATFGVLVWGFQEGNLAGLLGFTATGTLEATQPVLIFAMAFGLSMDYEVFLLSRIREEWDRTGDNTVSVARGLQRTGRIVTSAALLFVVVVGAFATSGITFIQMIGVGLAVAVVIDATVVRALLVPATMRLLGRWNWWAPAPMAWFWERYGLRESDPVPQVAPAPAAEPAPV